MSYRSKQALIVLADGQAVMGTVVIDDHGSNEFNEIPDIVDCFNPLGWKGYEGKLCNEYQYPSCAWSFVLLHDDISHTLF